MDYIYGYIIDEYMVHYIFQTLLKHFKTIPVNEKEALSFFIYTVKSNNNKLDHKSNSDNT